MILCLIYIKIISDSNNTFYKSPKKQIIQGRSVKLMFTRGHISLEVAFKGQNRSLGLYKCNYSLIVKRELGTSAGQKQGARPDKARWRAGFFPRALHLPPVAQTMKSPVCQDKNFDFILLAIGSHWKFLGRQWHFQSDFRRRMLADMKKRRD